MMKFSDLEIRWVSAGLKNTGVNPKVFANLVQNEELFFQCAEKYLELFEKHEAPRIGLREFLNENTYLAYSDTLPEEKAPEKPKVYQVIEMPNLFPEVDADAANNDFLDIWKVWPSYNPAFTKSARQAYRTIPQEDLTKFNNACKLYIKSFDSPGNNNRPVNFDKFIEWGKWYDYVIPNYDDLGWEDFEKTYNTYPEFKNKEQDKILAASKYFKFIQPEQRFDFFLACLAYSKKNSPFEMPYLTQEGDVDLKDPKTFKAAYVMNFMAFIGVWDSYLDPHVLIQLKFGLHCVKGFDVAYGDREPNNFLSRYWDFKGQPKVYSNYNELSFRERMARQKYPSRAIISWISKKRLETYETAETVYMHSNDVERQGLTRQRLPNPISADWDLAKGVLQYVIDQYGIKTTKADCQYFKDLFEDCPPLLEALMNKSNETSFSKSGES